eukprot:NODE_170_length_2575_cov_172.680523_g127_i0.p2 GENE.NODE_170_length_2575_cov_172.680523_g127_i0~~NODE_170_length_2575_cov_172.680523_g127_i0.p2  ORF type:complete len:614 (+),score=311.90 NODE_170_length_2575_cov_172.680523_g127_i0:76-1842(+)
MEAARKQKITNLRLKTACLENEEFIQELHVSDWSENQKQKLNSAHEKGAELLNAVETGTRWNLMQTYDLPKLMRVCGLEMTQRELYQPEDKPQFMDIVGIKKTLQEFKQNRNKTRVVSFTGMLDNCMSRIERIEDELRRSQLDATQLAAVPQATLKNLEDTMNVTNISAALSATEDAIKTTLGQIEKTAEIQSVAVADGEMTVAEEQGYIKIQLQERLLQLLEDKFETVAKVEEENAPFKRIFEVQKKANQETQAMKDAKRRLKQRCETDLKHIHDAIQKADLEDAEALKRFAAQKERSERYLKDNLEKQAECWRKIQDLEKQLQKLGTERFEEVRRRIEENDREEKRRVEYRQFLEVVGSQKRLLELTAYNCDVFIRCTGLKEELIAEACGAIKTRHDKTQQELSDLRLEIHKEYLEFFRMLYLTLGNVIYKKEKKLEEIDRQIRSSHIQLEMCVETFDPAAKKHSDEKKQLFVLRARVDEELRTLKDKQHVSLERFGPTEKALIEAGIEFSHPVDEQNEEVLSRRSKMVEYRAHLSKQEEVKIAAEREEIKRHKALRLSMSGSPTAGQQAITDGSPPNPAATYQGH